MLVNRVGCLLEGEKPEEKQKIPYRANPFENSFIALY